MPIKNKLINMREKGDSEGTFKQFLDLSRRKKSKQTGSTNDRQQKHENNYRTKQSAQKQCW